jgi:LuxR family quorum sensing-dependent transcriptional regulator
MSLFANGALTSREKEILTWVARGKTAREIGDILSVSRRTVEVHISAITGKLEASNCTHAVALAIHKRLVQI